MLFQTANPLGRVVAIGSRRLTRRPGGDLHFFGPDEGPRMNEDALSDIDVEGPDDFEDLLAQMIEKADHAGVDVRGAWEFRTKGSTYYWEVLIVEVDREVREDGA